LTRITEPTTGDIKIHGRVSSLLEVGTGFHPELTGRENVFLNGAILGMTKKEIGQKFDEIVAFAEIERFLDTPVKYYSSGMYVRLAFAVAAHLEPEILLVDEVLAVGDAAFQTKCLGRMGDVAKEGRTILFVSHNMQAVNTLCDRGMLLDQGRVKQVGKTTQVIADYLQSVRPNMSDLTEQTWPDPKTAPGNERIRLRRIVVKPEGDDGGQFIEMTTPFRVEIEYWNLLALTRLHVNMGLYSIDGAPAFETLSLKEPNWHGKSLPKGLFRSTCYIPANLMNEGTFLIRVLFVDDSSNHLFDYQGAAMFSVHDTAERKTLWYGRHHGLVHPRLIWKTECVNAED
jgi:lipopolysaccharide transport system ATP-binding protein